LLRTLGFTGGQLRVAVAVQVAVLVVTGAVLGTVIGLVAGRVVWKLVVDQVSLPYAPSVPWLAVLAVPIVGLVLAELLASVPRRTAARLNATEALRTE
jgi:ABC-type antimicrobial peptide transport system permease subunit